MEFKPIFEDNMGDYSDLVDIDIAENMGRMYYRGLAAHDPENDNPLSLLIYRLKSLEGSRNSESELLWIYAAEPSCIASLLDGYREEAGDERIVKTGFEFSSLEKEKEEALKGCGFSVKTVESRNIDVTIDDCKKLSITRKKAPSYVQSIIFLDYQEFYQGLMNILFRYDDPSQEDLAHLPKEWYEQSVSCFTKTDGRVNGFLLVHACPSGLLVPVLFFAVGPVYRVNLIEMLRFSIGRAAEIYPGDTVVRIHRRNEQVSALSSKFFPDKKGSPAVAGERVESN